MTIGIGTLLPSWPDNAPGDANASRARFEQARATLQSLTANYDVGGIRAFFEAGHPHRVLENLATGDTPLHWAARLRLIDETAEVHQAKLKGRGVEVLATLIQYLPPEAVNARNSDGLTPLMIAAEAGQDDNVRALLQVGASIQVTDDRGWTPLFFAAYAGADSVIVSLLGSSLPRDRLRDALDHRDAQGHTAFMIAVTHGNLEAAQELLDRGADINARNAEGKTALMLAELSEMTTGAEIAWLVEAGADEDIQDAAGMTAMQYIDAALDGPQDHARPGHPART